MHLHCLCALCWLTQSERRPDSSEMCNQVLEMLKILIITHNNGAYYYFEFQCGVFSECMHHFQLLDNNNALNDSLPTALYGHIAAYRPGTLTLLGGAASY